MPPGDPSLDEQLREYLQEQRAASRKGITLERVHDAVSKLTDRITSHEEKVEKRHEENIAWRTSQERRTVSLEKDVEHLSKDVDRVEDTGRHDIPEILRALPGRAVSGSPPRNGLTKVFENEAVKWIVRGLAIVVAALSGWLYHHLTGAPAAAAVPPAEVRH